MERTITIEAPDDVRAVVRDNARLNGEIAAAHVTLLARDAEIKRLKQPGFEASRLAFRDGLGMGLSIGLLVAFVLSALALGWTS